MSSTMIMEGKTDKEFIEQYLSFIDKKNPNFQILKGDICSKREELKDILLANKAEQCYIICDADDKRDKYVETIKEVLQDIKYDDIDNFIKNHVFLFPDNQQKGSLEHLIDQILVDKKNLQIVLNIIKNV